MGSVAEKVLAAGRRNTAVFAKCWRDGVEPAPHQYDMARRIDGPSQYQADFWPRDHGKSEIFCISYPLRRICEDPDVRILIVQKTATEAEKTLGVIKQELESNQRLRQFYRPHWMNTVGVIDISNAGGSITIGGEKEGTWQQSKIYVKRSRKGKDPTVEAIGVGGAITGGHYDVIILDDVEDDENTKTDSRLKSLRNWFTGTIMQLREPHTKMVVVGTLKTTKKDIYNTVIESPIWNTYLTGAILSHSLNEIEYELVRSDEDGTVTGVDVKTPDVETLWPGKWDIRTLLLEMVASLDTAIWIREKLNDLRALAGKIFKRKWFRYFDEEDLAEVEAAGWELLIQVWDTAYEEDETADFSVCITMGLYKGLIYILDVFRERLEAPDLEEAMKAQYEAFRPDEVLVEKKASGISMIQVLQKETGVPILPVSPQGRDKVARARATTPYLKVGRVLLLSGADWIPPFLSELGLFNDGDHDDQVDAFVYGVLRLMGVVEVDDDDSEPEPAMSSQVHDATQVFG